MTSTVRLILFASLVFSSAATAQESQDFMAGRLFQIALETGPNFTAAGPPTYGTLAEGQTQAYDQQLQPGTCYMWLAVGDTGRTDLDLAIQIDGTAITGDDALDDWPIATYCAPAAQTARIEVRMYSGSGAFAFNTYSRHFGPTDPLELQMAYLADLFAPEHVPMGPMQRGTLAAGGQGDHPLPLNGGQCYTVIGASESTLTDLDFFLLDHSGSVVESDVAPDTTPVIMLCPTANENYTLRATAHDGAGGYGYRVFGINY